MIEIDDTEAQEEFDALLDSVERGETFVIMRQGRAIARLRPHEPADQIVEQSDAPSTSSSNTSDERSD